MAKKPDEGYKLSDEVVLKCCTYVVTGLTIEGIFIHLKNDAGEYSINDSQFVPTERLDILGED